MPLTAVEQLALWGPPVLVLLLTGAYYVRWGKEADERGQRGETGAVDGGES